MLTEVMRECRNWFEHTAENGTYDILDNTIVVKHRYVVGQYIRIVGSVLNDVVAKITKVDVIEDDLYRITCVHIKNNLSNNLKDETFTGSIYGLRIPFDFLEIVKEIEAYQEIARKGDPTLVSESYRGYSYSRAVSRDGQLVNWKTLFMDRLKPFKRMFGNAYGYGDLPISFKWERDMIDGRELDA